jgi:hypothetical protein
MGKKPKTARSKEAPPTGIGEIDRLAGLHPCKIDDYILGVSAYVRRQAELPRGPKKASQIRLSNALARAFADELKAVLPDLAGKLITEEQKVAGGLRAAKADVSESHFLDGLRLAVELKPINLAVGRALWNRFGDIRTFAVNIHLKFPFAVVGGVLVIPTYEETGTIAAKEAEEEEIAESEETDTGESDEPDPASSPAPAMIARRSTIHLIERAVERLHRAGGRKSEADASHLLEGIAVVVFDPDTATIDPNLPKSGLGLRWDEFIRDIATSYRTRFED